MIIAYDPTHYRDNTTIEEMVDKVARLGYEYIELSPREDFCPFYKYPKVDKAKIASLKKKIARHRAENLLVIASILLGRSG
ncbi:hypothetical protein HMSSN036_33080 [Paenibacillus macerans]|nr:hypothetical protein HMSSN036_33080 [Paenibacillus macerans]